MSDDTFLPSYSVKTLLLSFFFNDTATTEIYTLSLHDALPIRDRPEDAVISDNMREAVRRLAERVPVVVVSGRDRKVVQKLMGLDNLIVAGDHGFDIWSPTGGAIQREEGTSFESLLREVEAKFRAELADIPGALVEPKKRSLA